jgi:hypothetical protein
LELRQQLQDEYSKRVRKLVRKHRFEQAKAHLATWRRDRNLFWRNYKPHGKGCPFTAKAMARFFKSKMNSYASPAPGDATVAPEPAPVPASTPTRAHTETPVDVTQTAPSVAEIITAIKNMHSVAAGVDGIPTALFKPWAPHSDGDSSEDEDGTGPGTAADAVAQIAAGLSHVFDRISGSSTVPTEWSTGLLSPIYKNKGDLADITNYRPLSIPSVACRLWSSITNQKLMAACSERGLLPDVMFGFTPGKSCSDPLFILRHLTDMHKGKQGEIFAVAFMDLSGAYDSVCRELMFEKLQKLVGLSEHSLATLQCLYNNTQCIVKGQYSLSEPFSVTSGVRQGCPLSTTLFNLFISDLHDYITQRCPGKGVRVRLPGGTRQHSVITDLGYADDIALCANNASDLQRILDAFADYCKANGLIINPSKCETVVFSGGGAWPQASWTVKEPDSSGPEPSRRDLARVQKFKYLGVELHGSSSITAAVGQRLACMVTAQSAVYRRLREMHVTYDPVMIADLFETITAASGSYGCEIWSTPLLSSWDAITSCSLQRYQASVYKRALGLPSSTSNMLAYFEMGRYPLQISWLVRTVKYWNKRVADTTNDHNRAVAHLPPDSRLQLGLHPDCQELLRSYSTLSQVFYSNVHFGLKEGVACWTKQLLEALNFIIPEGVDGVSWKNHMSSFLAVDSKAVLHAARQAFCQSITQFSTAPTLPVCPNRQRCKYAQWMLFGGLQANHVDLPRAAYLDADLPLVKKHAAARARLGSAPIRAVLEHQPTSTYPERICRRCNRGVDDEAHWLLKCRALLHIRRKYTTLLRNRRSVDKLMSAMYDRNQVTDIVNYIWDITEFVKGHRQGSNA